jgi:hypothetical protein
MKNFSLNEDTLKKGLQVKEIIFYSAIGFVLIVGGIIAAKKFIFKKKGEETGESTTKEAGRIINKKNLSYDAIVYNSMADRLGEAMFDWGTDEKTIFEILSRLKTKDDWYALVNAFGTRKEPGLLIYFEGNLIQWLQHELSNSDLKKVNDILSKIGVTI